MCSRQNYQANHPIRQLAAEYRQKLKPSVSYTAAYFSSPSSFHRCFQCLSRNLGGREAVCAEWTPLLVSFWIVLPWFRDNLIPIPQTLPAELGAALCTYRLLARDGLVFCQKLLTGHVEAIFSLLYVLPAVRTRFRVLPDPIGRLLEVWITMIPVALELLARLALMPRHGVLVAHFESTLVAVNSRALGALLVVIVQLPARTVWPKTPPERG